MVRMVEAKGKVTDKKRFLLPLEVGMSMGRDGGGFRESPSENDFSVGVSGSSFEIIINSPLKKNPILIQII
ncbi:hypothetical protein TorRG33x02_274800 [Trema orientale]|uniref:Uncharacterized protein n=1 Tax=Trema orientale TaxID=63057 RepID=A0A2P5CS98_TREOI|nr:hypothetical protein TorRG33x02_274800 [Trema orientale]